MDKKDAKLSQLKELSKEMSKMMGEGYGDSMQKVTVAADSKEGLEKGLSKAQELMKRKGLMEEMSDEEMSDEEKEYEEDIDDSEEEELEEDLEEMADDVDTMSPEEMMEKIKELKAKLAEME